MTSCIRPDARLALLALPCVLLLAFVLTPAIRHGPPPFLGPVSGACLAFVGLMLSPLVLPGFCFLHPSYRLLHSS